MEQRIIVIGGGIAGLSAAQAARDQDSQARIHLVCGEKCLPYYRTRICEVFAGTDPEKLLVRNYQWFTDEQIEVINDRVTSVNVEEKQVKFTDGSYLYYDKLIITTGAVGNLPQAEGNDRDNVMPLRFLADIERISAFLGQVVIIGDGLLGLEAAWHLSRAGRSVVIVGRGDRLLSRQLDKEGSVFFLGIVEKAGIRIALNGYLEAIDDNLVRLADGRGFAAGAVIFAAGIKSLTKIGRSAGAECNRAIVVDERMQTSAPDIFAAGDCAEYQGKVAGLWTVGMAQGAVAGANAAGGDRTYQPEQPAYMMNAMGTKVWSYGDINAKDGYAAKDSQQELFCKLFFDQGLLVGAELIGDMSQMIALKKAVDQRMDKDEAIMNFLQKA